METKHEGKANLSGEPAIVSMDVNCQASMEIERLENPEEFDTGLSPYNVLEEVERLGGDGERGLSPYTGIDLNTQEGEEDGLLHQDAFTDFDIPTEEVAGQVGGFVEQSDDHDYFDSPGRTRMWIPKVTEALKPVIGNVYGSLDIGETFYQQYAEKAGFEVRRSSQKMNNNGVIQIKYFVCSKYGEPLKKSYDSLSACPGQREVRNSNVKRTGCKACVKFRLLKGTSSYELYAFVEEHNHLLMKQHDVPMSRKGRQLKLSDKRFVHDAGTSNMGATRAHKLHTSLMGGYDCGGPTVVDYQNYKRDCNNFVGGGDAKVLVELMAKRKMSDPNFFFEYKCIGSELHCIFWADEISRFNYSEFGDVISFDATFRTNKHSMVFVPFTAVDNHNCNVIVGAALVGHEDIVNYTWLLEAFLKAHGKPPTLVLTDQCPAMKQAIADVFPDARHRLCMWHIMSKVPNKFSSDLLNNTTFRKQFNKLVWNVHIDPEVFEFRWKILIDEFCLQDHTWLKDMFNVRSRWIPAFFKDLPLCCLMKTTSRSESTNSFFNSFSSYGNNLYQFMLGFEFALEKQRREQRRLDYVTRTTLPHWLTHSKLEKNACDVYTRSVFFEVQTELDRAVWSCSIISVSTVDDVDSYVIAHLDKRDVKVAEYKVVRNAIESTVTCSCNHMGRHGYLCRHVFKVLMNVGVESIPEIYILRRWRRDLMPVELHSRRQRICDVDDEHRKLFTETYLVVDDVLDMLRNDKEKLASFLLSIKDLKEGFAQDLPRESSMKRKSRDIEQILGIPRPENIDIHPPSGIRNKGCGTSKRLIGATERAVVKSGRNKRLCRSCGVLANHDSRNCPAKER